MAGPHFAEVQPSPVEHFKLYFYAAVLHVVGEIAAMLGSQETAFKQFPFLSGYYQQFARYAPENSNLRAFADWWRDSLLAWEETAGEFLPLRALREAAGLDHEAVTLLVAASLNEEDARFGSLFEIMQGTPGQQRLTLGLLSAWWRDVDGNNKGRTLIRQLQDVGLMQVVNTEAPRSQWALQTPAPIWDAMRGERHSAPAQWARYLAPSELSGREQLVISDEMWRMLVTIPPLLASGRAQALVMRGPRHNGRRTLIGALARELDCGALEISGLNKFADERWQLAGSLATLLWRRTLPEHPSARTASPGPRSNALLPFLWGCLIWTRVANSGSAALNPRPMTWMRSASVFASRAEIFNALPAWPNHTQRSRVGMRSRWLTLNRHPAL